MIKKNMLKEYLRYILPTMLTFTLASVYSIVDGMFVGHAVGDAGVAGINVAFPLVAFVMAVGTGIGMGGGKYAGVKDIGTFKSLQHSWESLRYKNCCIVYCSEWEI